MLKLTYQTAIASLVQFITLAILSVPNTIYNIVTTCHSDNTDCVSNTIVSLIFYLLTVAWFAIIMLLGYAAQRRRSRQLAVILIGFEFITLIVAGYIDFPHETSILGKTTSLIDVLLSLWVIFLALRLFLSGSKRIVKKPSVIKRVRRSVR